MKLVEQKRKELRAVSLDAVGVELVEFFEENLLCIDHLCPVALAVFHHLNIRLEVATQLYELHEDVFVFEDGAVGFE